MLSGRSSINGKLPCGCRMGYCIHGEHSKMWCGCRHGFCKCSESKKIHNLQKLVDRKYKSTSNCDNNNTYDGGCCIIM